MVNRIAQFMEDAPAIETGNTQLSLRRKLDDAYQSGWADGWVVGARGHSMKPAFTAVLIVAAFIAGAVVCTLLSS